MSANARGGDRLATIAGTSRRRRAGLYTTCLAGLALTMSGCSLLPSLTVEDIPLPAPGGIGDSFSVNAVFENALNLPTRAKVKLNGTDVGQVSEITAKDYKARVRMDVSKSIELPKGTGAELRQATPLGDVFVALMIPPGAHTSNIGDGGTLDGPRTAAATVEDLLVSAAAVVDGGSLSSLQTVLVELSNAVSGDTTELSGAIKGFTTAISRFNANAGEVDRAMANTRVLTQQLTDGRAQMVAAIAKLPAAIDIISGQMSTILTTLDKTNKVTAATNDFLTTNKQDTVDLLDNLSTAFAGLKEAATVLGPLSDNLATLNPMWKKSTPGSAAAVSAKLYWLSPGVGFDQATRLPELQDIDAGSQSLQQTLTRILARLSGTKGCCG
ncbi:MlaD family protein [Gordonia sp. CPCC 205333]|uniref:MlaD family protein n=1 Tax=Gordonia sp. CPCC 205333 TaxID=3140790 RepID=UPI003AF331B2